MSQVYGHDKNTRKLFQNMFCMYHGLRWILYKQNRFIHIPQQTDKIASGYLKLRLTNIKYFLYNHQSTESHDHSHAQNWFDPEIWELVGDIAKF